MTSWSTDELDRVGAADEIHITQGRSDGSLRPWVPIWLVRVGDDLYVRSYRGSGGAWYRHATQRPEGRTRAGGIERDVSFEQPDDTVQSPIDAAYRAKYARYDHTYLQPMLAAQATATTLRLTPRN